MGLEVAHCSMAVEVVDVEDMVVDLEDIGCYPSRQRSSEVFDLAIVEAVVHSEAGIDRDIVRCLASHHTSEDAEDVHKVSKVVVTDLW